MKLIGKIQAGVILERMGEKIALCGCGEKIPFDGTVPATAFRYEKCGNENFVWLNEKRSTKVIGDFYKVLHKDDAGFTIEKTNVVAVVDKDKLSMKLKNTTVEKLEYSFKNTQVVKIYKNSEEVKPSEGILTDFFKGIGTTEILSEISTEKTRTLFEIAINDLSRLGYERSKFLSRGVPY